MAAATAYAGRLSVYPNRGIVGVSEVPDSDDAVAEKASRLAEWIAHSDCCVLHTGAGLSTSAGVPDFRGPKGVWTKEAQQRRRGARGRRVGRPSPSPASAADPGSAAAGIARASEAAGGAAGSGSEVNWDCATPTAAHMAVVALHRAGFVRGVVTQNVDCLHRRSGLPMSALAELHGNTFVERCSSRQCGREFVRDFDVGTVGLKPTGRRCPKCSSPLIDFALDWEDPLPPRDLALADTWSSEADLSVVLGSSMQMVPARDLPLRAARLAIVNLQPTVRDSDASLVLRGDLDHVLTLVLRHLNLRFPVFEVSAVRAFLRPFAQLTRCLLQRVTKLSVEHVWQRGASGEPQLRLSISGDGVANPFVASARVDICSTGHLHDRHDTIVLRGNENDDKRGIEGASWTITRPSPNGGQATAFITFVFVDRVHRQPLTVRHELCDAHATQSIDVLLKRVDYNTNDNAQPRGDGEESPPRSRSAKRRRQSNTREDK